MNQYGLITDTLQEMAENCAKLSDSIWDYAETAFRELRSSRALGAFLESRGFSVEWGVGGIPSAFTASWGRGLPCVGFLGEYDALPGLSQKAGAAEKIALEPGKAGHGCGHNLLGVGSAAAAAAAKEYLAAKGLPGKLVFFGCPAEEGENGKVFMLREGVFSGLDAALSWHPSYATSVAFESTLALQRLKVRFEGISSHAAIAPEEGRSALDALELMNVGINFLREHVVSRARIHYAITNPGSPAPNVVPALAEGLYIVRCPDIQEVMRIMERVKKIAQGAALMTETKVIYEIAGGVSEYIPNRTLNRELFRIMEEQGPPVYDEQDRALAGPFAVPGSAEPLPSGMLPWQDHAEHASVSTDLGDISWNIPMTQAYVGMCAAGTGVHTWQMTAQGKMPYSHKGMLYAARLLAILGARLFEDPKLLEEAKAETSERLARLPYALPIPADLKTPQGVPQ
jgi:aminobenzoyl-glutamate utilization protein B